MSAGEIVLAVTTVLVAVLGAWVGAHVGGRNAANLWRREFQAQEARWRQEVQLTEARYWRDRRSKLYAELLNVWRDLNEQFGAYTVVRDATKVDEKQLETARDQLLVVGKTFRDLASAVVVEASKPVLDLAEQSALQVSQFLGLIMEDYNLSAEVPRASKNELEPLVVQLRAGLALFEQQIRAELGVPPN